MERARQFLHVPPPSSHVHVSHVRCARSLARSLANNHPSRPVQNAGDSLPPSSAESALGSSRLRTRVGRSVDPNRLLALGETALN